LNGVIQTSAIYQLSHNRFFIFVFVDFVGKIII
jgi:hypothetical protein